MRNSIHMAQKLDTDTWYVRHCNGSQCCRHLDADAVPCGIRLPGWEPGKDSAEAETRSFLAGSSDSLTNWFAAARFGWLHIIEDPS